MPRELVSGLTAVGFSPHFDRDAIAPGEDWELRLGRLIEQSDTLVFVVSPDAVVSMRCTWEIERARQLNKRLLPIIWRDVPEADVPLELKRFNYIFFDKPHSFGPSLATLSEALTTDQEWLREHTRYAEAAIRWDRRQRAQSMVLRGEELATARAWLQAQPPHVPEPPLLIHDFLAAGESAEREQMGLEFKRLAEVFAITAARRAAVEAQLSPRPR